MKKIPIYTYIFIALIGIFIPIFTIQAQPAGLGTCYWNPITGSSPVAYSNMQEGVSYDGCLNLIRASGKIGRWYPSSPTPPVTTPPIIVQPQPQTTSTEKENTSYHLLEPIPDPTTNDGKPITDFPVGETGALGKYLNLAIKLFIGLCAVAAVVMIVIGGIEYSTSELISTKSAAKDRIQNAIFGLLLALGSYAILFTINPDLLNTEVDISGASITSSGEQIIPDLKQRMAPESGSGVVINPKVTRNKREFVCEYYEAAVTAGAMFNMDPVMILAQAGHESGWGGSTNVREGNNFFGFTAGGRPNQFWDGRYRIGRNQYRLNFRIYSNPENSFKDFARLIRDKYRLNTVSFNHGEYARRIAYSPYISEQNGDSRTAYQSALANNAAAIKLINCNR